MFKPLTILENLNWKSIFKNGHIFIYKYKEELKSYIVCGENISKKPRLISRFLLKEDVEKCSVIEHSDILEKYISEIRGK